MRSMAVGGINSYDRHDKRRQSQKVHSMSLISLAGRGIRDPRKAVVVIRHKLLSTIGHKNCRPFIVLSRSRTGSNLLISLLNSHPNVYAEGEILSELNGKNYKDILAKAFGKQPFHVKAKGFKIFYYHPIDDKHSGIWDTLSSIDDLHIIHLKRRNILHTLISRKVASIRDIWVVKSTNWHSGADRNEITVNFSIDELSEGFEQTRRWEQEGDDIFKKQPLISIYYEDLVNHREQTFRKITEFLGVRYILPKTNLKKQNTKSMRDTVTNFEALKSAFSETEWHSFFDD